MDQDAEAMLVGAGGVEAAVRARAPREHLLYVATGSVYPLAGLVLDLGDEDGSVASATVAVAGLVLVVAMLATHVPYWQRRRQVRRRRTSARLEWALALWGAVALFGLGALLADVVDLPHTIGGVVGAMPSLLRAERLRRAA